MEWILHNAPLLYAGVFILGLMVGSFLNVVILRLPATLEHDWRCQCRELLELEPSEQAKPAGIAGGRSHCPRCGHQIRALENVPLVSYLLLRGKCAECKAPISLRYPIVELLTAVLFLVCVLHFGPTVQAGAALVLTALLIAMTGIDFDHQLLPDNLTLPLMWLGLLLAVGGYFTDLRSSVIGAAAGYLSLWTVYHLFRLLTGKEGMGYGDFKLMAALGAWMGWQMIPLVILLSSVVGAVVGIVLMGTGKLQRDKPMPFGPFIAAAGWIALIWGEDIIKAYSRSSGFG